MADDRTDDHPLIDSYLDGLRAPLAARPDGDDAIDELRDHLLASVERHEAAGLPMPEAERRALEDLGDARTVAGAYTANGRGRPALPTSFTRLGGMAAFAAAMGFVLTVACWTMGDRAEAANGWEDGASQLWYGIGSVGVLWGTAGLLVSLVAVVRRHGGLGVAGGAAIALAGLGTFVSIAAWAVPVWASLLAAAWLVVAAATWRAELVPRRALLAIGLGLAGMPVLTAAADTGASDGWSGTGWAQTGGPAVGVVLVAAVIAGTTMVGRRLAGEDPVDRDLLVVAD